MKQIEALLSTAFEEIMNGKALLVDIREKEEWDKEHIHYAYHLPLSAIEKNKKDSFLRNTGHTILYIHCARGGRVRYLVEELRWGADQDEIEVIPLYTDFEIIKKALSTC